jgi:hypothetical protein
LTKTEYYIACYLRDSALNKQLDEESKRGYALYLKANPKAKQKKVKAKK